MLTVPNEIKELLHRDSCKKNIRIHFPNGERTDICNDLIVKDSVSFTESLCSQDKLKFGLCESPVFECETVGVGNIKGAMIEVSCEIFYPSTVTGAIWQNDLQAYVYQIPYGTFSVQSCERQADMLHRKILAYNVIASSNWQWGISESMKCDSSLGLSTNVTYEPISLYFLEGAGIRTADKFYDYTTLSPTTSTDVPFVAGLFWTYNGKTVDFNCTRTRDSFYYDRTSTVLEDLIECKPNINPDREEAMSSFLYEYGAPTYIVEQVVGVFRAFVDIYNDTTQGTSGRTITDDIVIYPWVDGLYNTVSDHCWISIPTDLTFFINYDGETQYFQLPLADPVVRKKSIKSSYSAYRNMKLSFNRKKKKVPNLGNVYCLDFNSYDLQKYIVAYFETVGVMGVFGRDGAVDMIDIKQKFSLLPDNALYPDDDLYPEGVTGGKLLPNDYQNCWYGDYYSKPFGAIQCQYKDSNNDDCVFILYLTGYDENSDQTQYQVYDLSDNYIIQQGVWTQAQIQTICNNIASNISGVTYMPVEFVGRGLPYVEAGDTFEILTKSNDSITTIVLNRTISGEITLTDTYKST